MRSTVGPVGTIQGSQSVARDRSSWYRELSGDIKEHHNSRF